MKYTYFLLLQLCLSASPLLSQSNSPAFCDDLFSRAKAELKKKEYGKSRDYCEAALPLCPDFTDRFAKVLEEVNTAIEAEKKKAEDNFLLAQEKTKEAKKEAANAGRALDEQKKAVAAQQAALTEIAQRSVRDAQTLIYHLDYEGGLATLKSAVALDAAQKEIADALLEIVFFFAETGKFDRAKGVLDTAAQTVGRPLPFPSNGWKERTDFRSAIKSMNPELDTFFVARYFPTMMPIPGGTDTLGSEEYKDEKPRHAVTLSPFKMAKTETTWWQYNLFCEATGYEKPDKPGWGSDGDNPVVNVTWYDAVAYANWLSLREGRSKAIEKIGSGDDEYEIKLQVNGYRLPTEAEWEYAARAHTPYIYAGSDDLDSVAWYGDNSGSRTRPAAGKKANAFGLNDMSGNVWEWCWDWYGAYSPEAKLNPVGPEKGDDRVLRGGSWLGDAGGCRVSNRNSNTPTDRNYYIGFRLSLQ